MKSNEEDIEHWRTDDIVCPWCGNHLASDLWVYEDEDVIDCGNCAHRFTVSIITDVTYTTTRKVKENHLQ